MEELRIQHPTDRRGLGFTEKVYRCELEPLGGSAFVLKDLQVSDSTPDASMPILHKGYFDSHAHPSICCERRKQLDLSQCRSVEEVLHQVEETSESMGGVLRGHSWDESRSGLSLEDFVRKVARRLPNHMPIILTRVCSHSAIVNQSFKELFGLPLMPDIVREEDYFSLRRRLPGMGLKERCDEFKLLQKQLMEEGLTAVGELWVRKEEVDMYRKLCDEGALLLDVAGCVSFEEAFEVLEAGPFALTNKLSLGPNDRHATFSARHAKFFLDGSFGTRTAALTRPYADVESFGKLTYETSALLEKFRKALDLGFFLSVHALGDAAVAQLGNAAQLLKSHLRGRLQGDGSTQLPQTYHRLEHAQLIGNQSLEAFDPDLWSVSIQPCHRIDDKGFILSRLGQERFANLAYRQKSFLDAKIPLSFGSDAPISSWNVIRNIRAAMEHHNPEERMSFSECVWAYTTGARLSLGLSAGKMGPRSTVYLATSSLR